MPPLPKPPGERRRRNAPMANTLNLPKAGRKGKPPAFPDGELNDYDAKVWADLWRTPMAVAWELNNYHRTVARYLRVMRAAETGLAVGDVNATLLGEVRQLEDRLGLTPMALLRLRWEIDDSDEVGAKRATSRKATSTRSRLKAVDPSAVARG